MSRDPIHLLLVEDNPGDARLIREMLNDELGRDAFSVHIAGSVDAAMEALQHERFGMVLLDLSLPDSFGLDTFRRIQSIVPSVPVIVLTGNQNQALALSAVKEGAQDFLVKNDLSGHLLVKAIHYASERKRIEASLRINEARFRSLAELSSDWYWEQDVEGHLIYVSEGLKEKSGIDPDRLAGRRWWDMQELDPNGGWDVLQKKMQAREPFNDFLLRFATSGPEAVFLNISGVPVASDSGAFAGYRGVGKDVSARERIDAKLRGSEERYRGMMDAAREGILMFDADGLVTFANRRICSMLGYAESEMNGRHLAAFASPPSSAPFSSRSQGHDDAAAADGSNGGFELRRKDGSSLWTMKLTYPVTAKDGAHAGSVSIFTDITEFRQQEERIRQLAVLAAEKGEAERANLAKSRFLAAVSHDLRQPMHALGLFIEDLRGQKLGAAASRVLTQMDSALELTNGLLETIIVMSGLESGMVTPHIAVFPVQRVLDRVAQTFGAMAEKKGLRLLAIPHDALIRSDPALLERVIFNLVSNALRYTDKGGVAVGCRRQGSQLRLEVWDTGLGIPDEFREEIFREFYRIEGEGRNRGGLGLGLAIVQSCAALLGHPLGLTSVPGRGSRFFITVPRGLLSENSTAAPEEEPTQALTDAASFVGLKVLVIDDDELLLAGTASLLTRWGCEVLAARSGREAHALMANANTRAGLVVSDLKLAAGETGIAVISELREAFGSDLPAMILTADRSLQTSREIKRRGLVFLYKPVPTSRLRALMAQLLGRSTQPQ